jgi:hypothetical protein
MKVSSWAPLPSSEPISATLFMLVSVGLFLWLEEHLQNQVSDDDQQDNADDPGNHVAG